MLYDYFLNLNWNVLSSDIWREFVRGASESLDQVITDIQLVRNAYISWKNPNDFANSRGIIKLPGETDVNFFNRVIHAYSFWKTIHNPVKIKELTGYVINEYPAPNHAEFSLVIPDTLSSEQLSEVLRFIHTIKPARSLFRGVIMSDTFLVSKDHAHTGGDDGSQVDHLSLGSIGTLSHAQLESVISALQDKITALKASAAMNYHFQSTNQTLNTGNLAIGSGDSQEINDYWVPLWNYGLLPEQTFSVSFDVRMQGLDIAYIDGGTPADEILGHYALRLVKYSKENYEDPYTKEIIWTTSEEHSDVKPRIITLKARVSNTTDEYNVMGIEGIGAIFYERTVSFQYCDNEGWHLSSI